MKSPNSDCRAVLVYGPDAGLVSERAGALAQIFAKRGRGQTEIVRLDDRDLAEDPARIEVELKTVPLFAGQSVVRVTASQRLDVPSLKALLATPFENILIVEAGNLRPDSGLRKLFEGHKSAAALPCYSDEKFTLGVIDAELREAGLSIDRETRDYLMTRLGADQALSRSEVVKLAIYAQDSGHIAHEDVEAIVGDAAETALDNFAYAVSGGDAKAALAELQRLAAAGTDRSAALSALGRHFTQLHRVAAAASSGGSLEQAAKSLKPRLHFKREPIFITHCKRWGASRLSHALPLIQEAVRRSRRSPDLDGAFAERLVLALTSRI
ncbi:MAG TPA: DNA polymerase III subunit delta [Methyloceanibacter sp.]|nr:DNA polymerase III subunit delta [Methyloceanibacter sp.]